MHAETQTGEFKLNLPPDLLSELDRRAPAGKRDELRVESFRPSFLGRVMEKLAGKRAR